MDDWISIGDNDTEYQNSINGIKSDHDYTKYGKWLQQRNRRIRFDNC